MANTIYEVYQGEELISSGGVEKVANQTGLSTSSVYNYCSKSDTYKGWTFSIKTKRYEYDEVDYEKIKDKLKEFSLFYKDAAEVLGFTPMTFSQKMRKLSRFKNTEIEELEDLFFLEEGTLIKEEK